jgi:acetolactate synthase regulatory subunit
MSLTARLLTLLAVIYFVAGCSTPPPAPPSTHVPSAAMILPADVLTVSPHKIVGRIVAVDTARGFAFVSLTATTPAAALADGGELIVRSDDLTETGRLRTSRYTRGRTLGAQIISGQPKMGDEVVFHD